MYVIDLEGNEYVTQLTYTIQKDLKGNVSLSTTILPNKPNIIYMSLIEKMWKLVDDDGIEYRIVYVKKEGEGLNLRVDIKAIPLFFDNANVSRINVSEDVHMTAKDCFDKIFHYINAYGHRYVAVIEDVFEAIQWEGFGNHKTCLKVFQEALDRYGAEFFISGNNIHIKKKVGEDTNHMYRHKLNASNIVEESDATDYYTIAYGYGDYGDGDGGEDWQDAKLYRIYVSPLLELLGYRLGPPLLNGNITVASTMDEKLKEIVDSSLKLSITADIRDLRKQNYPIGQSNIGDRVFIIDERIKLEEEVRVVNESIVKDWTGRVLDISLTFGTDGVVKRKKHEFNSTIQSIDDIFKGFSKLPYSALDNAVIQATEALKNVQTELVFPKTGGILAVDKNNPNLVTLFNSAGLGVSNDGGRTFKNAITGNGIVAERIMAGVVNGLILQGSEVIGGRISTTGVRSSITLQGGVIRFYDRGVETSNIDGLGHRFFYNGYSVGRISASWLTTDVNKRGLTFGLESDSHFMAWSYRVNPSDVDYTMMMAWIKGEGLKLNDDVSISHKLKVNGESELYNTRIVRGGRLYVGDKGVISSSSNDVRIGPNANTYLYVTDEGSIALMHNGNARFL